MKVKLDNGREFDFPDAMEDDHAVAHVRQLLAAEEKATQAQALAKIADDRLQAVVAQVNKFKTDLQPLIEELKGMRSDIGAGFAKMIEAQLADTIITGRDEDGATRSAKVIR